MIKNDIQTIGGFFALELGFNNASYHPNAIALTSGRSCFNLILTTIKAQKVYLPYYICDAILLPLKQLGITYEFYHLNESLKPKQLIKLNANEYFLFVNYFGIATKTIDELYEQYGDRLIIDNTHDFFSRNYKNCWSFNSARKFFGVPDGAYLYTPGKIECFWERNADINYSHLIERSLGKASAYETYKNNEAKIKADILGMSLLSEKILSGLDYPEVIKRRKSNFAIYAEAFSKMNKISIFADDNEIPLYYPFWCESKIQRSLLSKHGIFIPTFWNDTIHRNLPNFKFEKQMTSQLLPLPVDHRYNSDDCRQVISAILQLMSLAHLVSR